MSLDAYRSCIEVCSACAAACDHCAAACLAEDNPKMMVRCIGLDVDCADVCYVSAAFMARGSARAKQLCNLCADLCEQCGEECAKHQVDYCQQCAAACRKCAEECRRMAA